MYFNKSSQNNNEMDYPKIGGLTKKREYGSCHLKMGASLLKTGELELMLNIKWLLFNLLIFLFFILFKPIGNTILFGLDETFYLCQSLFLIKLQA